MRTASLLLATFVLAVVVGAMLSPMVATQTEAKPTICILAVYPFLVCEPSNRCHDGQQYCWECQGRDPAGVPCLCRRVGCM